MKIGCLVLLGAALVLLVGSAGAGAYDTYTCAGVCVYELPEEFVNGVMPAIEAESESPFVILDGRRDQLTIDLFLDVILTDPVFGVTPDGTWVFPYRAVMGATPVITVIGLGETTIYLSMENTGQESEPYEPPDEGSPYEPAIETPILHQSGHSLLTRYSEAHDR